MKITLTLAEVHAIIATKLGLQNFELDIIRTPTIDPDVAKFFEAMKPFTTIVGTILPHEKISAIRRFREFFPNPNYYPSDPLSCGPQYLVGLAIAKRTIEDWWNFSANVQSANRMPTIAGDDWTF
jgi:hypothetical protein